MEVKLDITPEQLSQQISEAVLKSTIGQNILRVVQEKCKDLDTWTLEKEIKVVIEREVSGIVLDEIFKRKERLRSLVEAKLTDELLAQLAEKLRISVSY